METTLQGRVYKFGDNINSDIIIAGRYLIYIDPDKLAEHAFEMLGDGFPSRLRHFDILVAGRNFGCGSARLFGLFDSGRHLCHRHQRSSDLVEQLVRVLFFRQRLRQ